MGDLQLSKHDDHLADWLDRGTILGPEGQNIGGLNDTVRYDHSKQQWHIWDSYRWAPDKIGAIYELTRIIATHWMVNSAGDPDVIKALLVLLDRSKKDSVLKSYATRPTVAMKGDEWDPDPTLLAFTNGVLDLKTLEFDTHPSPSLLLSRSTRQPWDQSAAAPRFDQFMEEVMGGDAGLIQYLGFVLGYSLFGWQREQKFWLWVGQGQNGKGTLAKVIAHALGDYADSPSAELYMKTRFGAARSDAARPDLLRLQGVRFAWMSEPSGGQFHEELLKAHTGDDPIQARDLYGKAASFTTFRPSHTNFFLTNNPPRTEDVGLSMRRRVRVFRFLQDFTGAREDKGLEAKLKEEAPGILARLAVFAYGWYQAGTLPEPQLVTDWSNEYIAENDPLAVFIGDDCIVERGAFVSSAVLWAAYQDWCARNDLDAGSQMGFGLAMSRTGRFPKKKTRSSTVYAGLRVKSATDIADD